MKSVCLFCTKIRYFLTEIPPLLLLAIAIKYNSGVESTMKLYPLIIVMSGVVVFIALYFFRAVKINNEEIKAIGLFSSREKAVINKDKTLHITVLPKNKIRVELFGDNDNFDTYAWLKNEETTEINLFRAKANGNEKTVHRILSYFGAEKDDIQKVFSTDGFSIDYEKIAITSEITENIKIIKVYFKETI